MNEYILETTKWHMQDESSSAKDLPDAFKILTLKHFVPNINNTIGVPCETNCKWKKIRKRIVYSYKNSFYYTNRFLFYYFW